MTPAKLHNFLIQPSQLGTCVSVKELVLDLQLLGRVNGPGSDWAALALMRQDEAGMAIAGWMAELERGGLVRAVTGKWVGVVAPVVEKQKQQGLF